MATQKQLHAISFKVSSAMKARLEEECAKDNDRSQADMAKILMNEALLVRDALGKGNTKNYL